MNRPVVLVTGASGYIGGRLVPRRLASGVAVRCLARTPGRLAGRAWSADPAVTIAQGDALDGDALYPVHQVVFDGLIDAIHRRAESAAGAA